MSKRTFWIAALVVTLLIAGVGSYYASAHPDGLEYVAEKTGFIGSAEDSPTSDSPFADYGTKGVDDERLGGGLAGVAGVLIVLVLAGGLAYAVRRRGSGLDVASKSD
ncbi:putative membrane protein [Nocardioides thalensis]|uniref:Putative membrane protein n=1 Tax=Nocardioides thalensis TaxID=1914755 RepID=A0A853BZE2_9ACTN|nr:PDGLE domain-containing protein [Nocardioides thalensis]NYJ00404.1 putative membrane protein [Nocardioides thalensis]